MVEPEPVLQTGSGWLRNTAAYVTSKVKTSVVDPDPHGGMDPELLFRIQQKMKEQINKNLISNLGL